MLLAGMSEPFRRHPLFGARDIANTDQPLEQFLAARLGPELARTLGSALVHGIYAADSRILSVRAAFPSLWELARDGWGSIARGVAVRQMRHLSGRLEPKEEASYDIGRVSDLMRGVSVYSFKEGMTTIVHALEDNLMRRSNVAIRKNEGIASLSKDSGSFTVSDVARLQSLADVIKGAYYRRKYLACLTYRLCDAFVCTRSHPRALSRATITQPKGKSVVIRDRSQSYLPAYPYWSAHPL